MSRGQPLSWDPIAEAREQWRQQGWDKAATGMAAVTSVMRTQQILLNRIDATLRPFGLSFARFELLRLIGFAQNHRIAMSRARALLQVHPTSLTNVVDRLEKDELVRRAPDPHDGRSVYIELLPAGSELVERATLALNEDVFENLGVEEDSVRELIGALAVFRRASGDFTDPPVPPEPL